MGNNKNVCKLSKFFVTSVFQTHKRLLVKF